MVQNGLQGFGETVQSVGTLGAPRWRPGNGIPDLSTTEVHGVYHSSP